MAALRAPEWKTVPWRPAFESSDDAVSLLSPSHGETRLIYPYSIVPGGIEDAAELAEALARDPVVLEHYRGFASEKAQVMLLAQPKLAYVSYRVKDQIYWTRKKVRVNKGEKLISDGKKLIRGRCGNRISDTPQGPVALVEPPEVSSDTPLLPLPLAPVVKPIEPPASAPTEDEEKETHPTEPVPVVGPDRPAEGAIVTPVVVPIGGGGSPPGSAPGGPAGTPSGGAPPPSNPSTTPTAPSPEPPGSTQPPSTGPGSPSGAPPAPPSPTPAGPPGTPDDPPSSNPPSSAPPSTDPGSPAPASAPSTSPSPAAPAVTQPPAAPPSPLEPPLPGTPSSPHGVNPPGPSPTPLDVIPPNGVPGTTPAPPPMTPIPEPSTYLLIGGGLAAMILVKRRRSQAVSE